MSTGLRSWSSLGMVACLACWLGFAAPAAASTPPEPLGWPASPCNGLVAGGGGARGDAHIGVLREL
jgi:hypothetical protein